MPLCLIKKKLQLLFVFGFTRQPDETQTLKCLDRCLLEKPKTRSAVPDLLYVGENIPFGKCERLPLEGLEIALLNETLERLSERDHGSAALWFRQQISDL